MHETTEKVNDLDMEVGNCTIFDKVRENDV